MGVIIFVCTGNVCRSPMAVGLMRQRLASEGQSGQHRVCSAGVWALDGQSASDSAIAVMAERGIDISDHVSHTITADDVARADVILVMTRDQADLIRNTWPQYAWKTYCLSDLGRQRKDIDDPYGKPIGAYRACADLISLSINRGFQRILELA